MKLKNFLQKKNYLVIALNVIPSGHHIVKAKINGKKGVFILDTGASNTCIDSERIKYFKLKTKKTSHKATGAGTNEIDIEMSKKNFLIIADWKIKKLPLVVMDLSHINDALSIFNVHVDGIIGSDILHKGKGIIQYDKDLLFLKKKN
jgi:hypothetical protein